MAKYDSKRGAEEKDPIITLLKLPAKSLEVKVKQLESEIDTRKQLSNKSLSTLETRILRLQDQLELMRYLSVFSPGFAVKRDFESQITRLEALKISETMSCFKDLFELTEKLETTLEELEIEKHKLRLLDPENNDHE